MWHYDVAHRKNGRVDDCNCGRTPDYHDSAYKYWKNVFDNDLYFIEGMTRFNNSGHTGNGIRPYIASIPSAIREILKLDPARDVFTQTQRDALLDNAQRACRKTFPELARKGKHETILNFLRSNPRWKFLNQSPEARETIIQYLKTIGLDLPPGLEVEDV